MYSKLRIFRLAIIVFLLALSGSPLCQAMEAVHGFCQAGGVTMTVPGGPTLSPKGMATYPGCLVTVYITGSSPYTTATLYRDNLGNGLSNPFPASSTTGAWTFFAPNGRYDIRMSGGGIPTPFTLGDNMVFDPGNTAPGPDASTYPGADLGAQVIAAAAGCPAAGCTVHAEGITTNLAINSALTLASPGGGPVKVVLPIGTITRACGASIIVVSGSGIQGQGKDVTKIVSTGCTDSAVTQAAPKTAYVTNLLFRDLTVDNSSSGTSLTAMAFDLPGAQNALWFNVAGRASGIGRRIGGLATGGNDSYNVAYASDFWGNTALPGSYGDDMEGYANSNHTFGGSVWGYTAIGNGGWGNFYDSTDIESSNTPFDTQSAIGTGGNGLNVVGAYTENGVGTAIIRAGSKGNYWTGMFPALLVSDLDATCQNFYQFMGSNASDGFNPECMGVQDRIQFGSGPSGYNGSYYIQGDRGGTIALEAKFDQALNRLGYYGAAPLRVGELRARGILSLGQLQTTQLGTPNTPAAVCSGDAGATTYTYYLVGHDWRGGTTLPSAASSAYGCNATLGSLASTTSTYAAGSGYHANDILTVAGGSGTGQVKVLTINGSGGILTVSIQTPGTLYADNVVETLSGGFGSSGSVLVRSNVVTITPSASDSGFYTYDFLKTNTATAITSLLATRGVQKDSGQATAAYATPTWDSTGDAIIAGNLTVSTLTSGKCVQAGTGGILTSTAAACGSGGGGGGGNVLSSGTPTNGQIAQWTNSTTIQGISTLPAAVLPVPTASTLGGIESIAQVPNNWVQYIDTSGVPWLAQPAFTDISGIADASQLPLATLPIGVVLGSLDTGFPSLTYGVNSITANQPVTAPAFVSSDTHNTNQSFVWGVGGAYAVVASTIQDQAPSSIQAAGYNEVRPGNEPTAASLLIYGNPTAHVTTKSFLPGATAGDIAYFNGSAWAKFAGNTVGTKYLSETAAGVLGWGSGGAGGSPSLDLVTGAAALATATEVGAGDIYTYNGVETAALTYPFVIQNTSASNNTSGALIINTAGAGTGQVPLVINETTAAGNFLNLVKGGTVTNGVLAGGTSEFSVDKNGNVTVNGDTTLTTGSVKGSVYEGSASTVATYFIGGQDASSTGGITTGTALVRTGNETGATGANGTGALTLHAGDLTTNNAGGSVGATVIRAGRELAGVKTGPLPGFLVIAQEFIKGAQNTVGLLQCLSDDYTVTDCTVANTNPIGINIGVNTNAVDVQTSGIVSVNFASATPSAGWYACSTTISGASYNIIVQAGACTAGQQVGIVVKGGGPVTSTNIMMQVK
jgi:hypothetical protein